ncbi:uncharacterized protein LOC122137784 [Cyprinus carpio]|uniref:Uncharacterized protein LOC122137784 n=1 Tax=Cyprinus carpio TaxID=7962 RepID=A0A9Q9WGR0_CYPCA|nr:uncharacterized protein LOC122137784 [Cyprinus carpio]
MTMAEAGLRVRPNLSRFTMATIIRAFRQHNRVERMPHRGGRVAIFTAAQETLIVDMVRENNLIRLREIRDKVIADNVNFESIDVSLATIDRVLRPQKMRMKRVYRVPFERNSARHKDLRYEYVQVYIHLHSTVSGHTVLLSGLHYFWTILCYLIDCSEHLCTFTLSQRILQLDAMARPHEYLFLDEAASTCRNEGKEAVTSLAKEPSLRFLANGGVITLCAAMEELKDILLDRQQHHPGPAHHIYVIIWDNVHFHKTNQIREWFTTNSNHFLNVCLPPYSPFLNPIEEFFSSWRWKVYDRQPYTRENLLRAMELACVDIPVEAFQG